MSRKMRKRNLEGKVRLAGEPSTDKNQANNARIIANEVLPNTISGWDRLPLELRTKIQCYIDAPDNRQRLHVSTRRKKFIYRLCRYPHHASDIHSWSLEGANPANPFQYANTTLQQPEVAGIDTIDTCDPKSGATWKRTPIQKDAYQYSLFPVWQSMRFIFTSPLVLENFLVHKNVSHAQYVRNIQFNFPNSGRTKHMAWGRVLSLRLFAAFANLTKVYVLVTMDARWKPPRKRDKSIQKFPHGIDMSKFWNRRPIDYVVLLQLGRSLQGSGLRSQINREVCCIVQQHRSRATIDTLLSISEGFRYLALDAEPCRTRMSLRVASAV